MIYISSDWSEVDKELDRLAQMPTAKTKQVLNGVLNTGFASTQAVVHVESGKLKVFGKTRTSSNKAAHTWTGEISYSAKRKHVDYAIYEKRRGTHWVGPSSVKGDHDFFRPLESLDPLWIAAVKDGLRG